MKGKAIKKLYQKLILGAVTVSMIMSLSACSASNSSKNAKSTNKNNVETSVKQGDKQSNYPVTITNYNFAGEEIKVTLIKCQKEY